MARVIAYDTERVAPTGPDAGGFRAPSEAGFDVAAKQQQAMGAAVEGAGTQVSDIAIKAQDQANQLRVMDATNQAREVAAHLAYDEKDGYTAIKGHGVMELPSGQPLAQDYTARYQAKLQDISGSLANDAQRRLFGQTAGQLVAGFETGATQHESNEYHNWAVSVPKGAMEILSQKWGKDPTSVTQQDVEDFNTASYHLANLQGISGNEAKAMHDTALSAAIAQSIDTAVSSKNTAGAKYLLSIAGDKLLGPDLARATAVLQRQDSMKTAMDLGDNFTALLTGGNGLPGAPTKDGTPTGPVDWHSFFGDFVAKHEGGKYVVDSNGYGVKWGINAQYNPSVDVKNLTKEEAYQIFMKQYVQKSGADKIADPATAMQHADMFFLNESQAGKILQQSGGDPQKYGQMRQQFLDGLVAKDPGRYGRYQGGWTARTNDLAAYTQRSGGQSVNPNTGEISISPEAAMQWVRTQLPPDADPETRQAAETRVLWALNQHKESVKQATDQTLGSVYSKLVTAKGDMEQLTPDEIRQIPAAEMPKVIAFSQTMVKNEEPDPDKAAAVYGELLSHPEHLKNMTDADYMKLNGQITAQQFAHIGAIRGQLSGQASKGPDLKAGKIDYRTINATTNEQLTAMGLPLKTKADDPEAAHVGAIRQFAIDTVTSAQRQRGKALSDIEVRGILTKAFTQAVTTQGGANDPVGNFLGITSPVATQLVPQISINSSAQIHPEVRQNIIRGLTATGLPTYGAAG